MNPEQSPNSQSISPGDNNRPDKRRAKFSLAITFTVFLILLTGIVFYFWVKSSPSQQSSKKPQVNTTETSQQETERPKEQPNEEIVKKTKEEPAEQPISETCLVPTDAQKYFGVKEEYLPQDVTRYFYSETIYFNADSADYSSPEAAKSRYDKMAGFYTQFSKKTFLYYIQATTYEDNTSAEGARIAQARTDRAKLELTSRGIPISYISIDQARTSTYNAEAMRNVVITIKGSSDCQNNN